MWGKVLINLIFTKMGQFGSCFFKCIFVCVLSFNYHVLTAQSKETIEFLDITLEHHDSLVVAADTRMRWSIPPKKEKREVVVTWKMLDTLKSIKRKKRDSLVVKLLQNQNAYLLYDSDLILWDIVKQCSSEQYSAIDSSYYINSYPQICTKKEGWNIRDDKEYVGPMQMKYTFISTNYFIVIQVNWRTLIKMEPLISYDDKYFHTYWFSKMNDTELDFPIKVLIPLRPTNKEQAH